MNTQKSVLQYLDYIFLYFVSVCFVWIQGVTVNPMLYRKEKSKTLKKYLEMKRLLY